MSPPGAVKDKICTPGNVHLVRNNPRVARGWAVLLVDDGEVKIFVVAKNGVSGQVEMSGFEIVIGTNCP